MMEIAFRLRGSGSSSSDADDCADRRSKAKTITKKGEGDRETGASIEVLNAGHHPMSLSRYSRWRLRTSR
jgi:hypothetical protein